MDIVTLTDDQIRQYYFDGYLHIPSFVNVDDLQTNTAVFDIDNPTRVENFVDRSAFFKELSIRISYLVGQLFSYGSDIHTSYLYKEKINFKRPYGRSYGPHYDGPSLASHGLASEFIIVQISIDDQTEVNGCLQGIFPVYNCPPILEDTTINDGRSGLIKDNKDHEWTSLPTKAGDILIFNHWFPHRSDINYSSLTRRTAYLSFNPYEQGDHHQSHIDRITLLNDNLSDTIFVNFNKILTLHICQRHICNVSILLKFTRIIRLMFLISRADIRRINPNKSKVNTYFRGLYNPRK